MENFVKRMIKEHADLSVKLNKLEDYIYSEDSDKDNKAEFANKCIQLSGMRLYEKALRARLNNQNIEITENGEYFEKVGQIVEVEPTEPHDEEKEPVME